MIISSFWCKASWGSGIVLSSRAQDEDVHILEPLADVTGLAKKDKDSIPKAIGTVQMVPPKT